MDHGDPVDVECRFVGGLQFVFDLSGRMAEVLLGCAVDRVGLLLWTQQISTSAWFNERNLSSGNRGGLLRMAQAVRAGIHRDTLRVMVEQGKLEKISRGLYQLVDAPLPSHPDLAVVAAKVPDGVICLISALAFHELTTQIPHEVYLAIDRNSEPPRIDHPPVRTFRFSGSAYSEGIETHNIGPVTLRVYSREKTLADCFKFRNKIGLDTCLEALRAYRQQRRFDSDAILRFAAVCRVTNIMRPYVESVL